MKRIKNNSGFSLIELMLVLSIITVLAVLGAQQLEKLKGGSARASGKLELAQIYTVQKTFFAEWDTYYPNLFIAGYRPEGTHIYSVGFRDGQVGEFSSNNGENTNIKNEFEAGLNLGNTGADLNSFNTTEEICSAMDRCTFDTNYPSPGTLSRSSVSAFNLFTAQAKGRPNIDVSTWDDWTIDQSRNLIQHSNGQ